MVVSSDIDAQEAEQAGLTARIAEPDAPYGAGDGTPLQSLMRARRQSAMSIEIRNAREHNLKNVNVEIPRDKFTVITGVSGSGKSTLAFDILFNEGQRRYLESLNAYARAIVQPAGKPDVDAIFGIPPTVAIEQRTSRGGRKSTVATMTEIHHFLRLLYVKLGTQYCPDCNVAVEPQNTDQIVAAAARAQGRAHRPPGPAGHRAQGLLHRPGQVGRRARPLHLRVDGQFIPVAPWPRLDHYKEHTIELPVADVVVDPANEAELRAAVKSALENGQGVMSVVWPVNKLHEALDSDLQQQHFSVKRACPSCGISFPNPIRACSRTTQARLVHRLLRHRPAAAGLRRGADRRGNRLERLVRRRGQGLHAVRRPAPEPRRPRRALARQVDRRTGLAAGVGRAHLLHRAGGARREGEIARDILTEIRGRLNFMQEVGLNYLALDRAAPTLSGGEAQRIRLAAQLGSNLQGVCYVLDEPTIGLHPRDNRILLDALARLEGNGNTLVVVEHDDDTIRRASHIIDIGPGAGVRGGRVVAGQRQDLIDAPESVTGRYLAQPLNHPLQGRRPVEADTPMIRSAARACTTCAMSTRRSRWAG